MLAKDLKPGEIGVAIGLLSPLRNHKLLKLNGGQLVDLSCSHTTIYKETCDYEVKLIDKINI